MNNQEAYLWYEFCEKAVQEVVRYCDNYQPYMAIIPFAAAKLGWIKKRVECKENPNYGSVFQDEPCFVIEVPKHDKPIFQPVISWFYEHSQVSELIVDGVHELCKGYSEEWLNNHFIDTCDFFYMALRKESVADSIRLMHKLLDYKQGDGLIPFSHEFPFEAIFPEYNSFDKIYEYTAAEDGWRKGDIDFYNEKLYPALIISKALGINYDGLVDAIYNHKSPKDFKLKQSYDYLVCAETWSYNIYEPANKKDYLLKFDAIQNFSYIIPRYLKLLSDKGKAIFTVSSYFIKDIESDYSYIFDNDIVDTLIYLPNKDIIFFLSKHKELKRYVRFINLRDESDIANISLGRIYSDELCTKVSLKEIKKEKYQLMQFFYVNKLAKRDGASLLKLKDFMYFPKNSIRNKRSFTPGKDRMLPDLTKISEAQKKYWERQIESSIAGLYPPSADFTYYLKTDCLLMRDSIDNLDPLSFIADDGGTWVSGYVPFIPDREKIDINYLIGELRKPYIKMQLDYNEYRLSESQILQAQIYVPSGPKSLERQREIYELESSNQILPSGFVIKREDEFELTIEEYISHGGYGITYKARYIDYENRIPKTVAVKEFFIDGLCARDSITNQVIYKLDKRKGFDKYNIAHKKFIKEAQVLQDLAVQKNQNIMKIIRLVDRYEETNTSYYIMDYYPDGSLNDYINSDEKYVTQNILLPVARALADIHAENYAHLDVKPSNILWKQDGQVVLIDFGTVKHYDEEGQQTTSSGNFDSSRGFSAPEVLEGKIVKFTPAPDIYSLGATMYKILTGNTLPAYSKCPIVKAEGLSLKAFDIINKAILFNPEDRYHSMEEMIEELTQLI